MASDESFLETAFHAHTDRKVRLRTAIAKKETVDADSVGSDTQCALGKWLHGDDKVKYGQLSAFSECVSSHAAFHKAAGQIARAISAQRFEEASKLLEAGTAFSLASTEVGLALAALKKQTQR